MSSSSPSSRLWEPSHGIRFAPKQDAVLYPVLDMSRFYTSGAFAEPEPGPVDNLAPAPGLDLNSPCSPGPSDGLDYDSGSELEEGMEEDETALKVPLTSLEYNISEKLFREAKMAKEGTPGSFWSYTMYRGPLVDGIEKRVKVHYCKTKHSTERACQYFLNEPVIGFDMEWEALATAGEGPKPNVSLIQIASPSRIALFHVAQFPARDAMLAPSFKKLMEDPEVTKVGVAIKGDASRLFKFLKVESKGLFELSHLYRLVKYSNLGMPKMVNKKLVPLAKQVEEYLGLPLFKGQDVRSSHWSRPLNMSQILYSASDAYVGLQLYHVLEKERMALDPCPPRPFHADLNLPIRLSFNVTAPAPAAESASVAANDSAAIPSDASPGVASPGATIPSDASPGVASPDAAIPSDASPGAVPPGAVSPGTTCPHTTRRTPNHRVKKPKLSRCSSSDDDRILAAETWVAEYRAAKTTVTATHAKLRSFHIWRENPDLTLDAIAAILRDPPLLVRTVAGYILQSIVLEDLQYDKARLSTEVLPRIPKDVIEKHYKGLFEATDRPDSGNAPEKNTPSLGEPQT